MLEHGNRALVVVATQQHLAEQREAEPVAAVDLDDPQQLALRLFPHVQRAISARERDETFEVIGGGIEAGLADRDRIFGSAERQIGLGQIDERRRRRIAPNEIDQLLDFLSRWPAIRIDHACER